MTSFKISVDKKLQRKHSYKIKGEAMYLKTPSSVRSFQKPAQPIPALKRRIVDIDFKT